jgi:hypothetical protein
MTTTAQPTLLEQLKPLAAELADVQSKISDLQERESALKAQIRDLVPGPDTYDADGLAVTVQSNRRFDPAAFTAAFPVTTHPQFYKLVPDTTAVKRGLSPDAYAAFMAEVGDFKVGLR